MTAGATPPTTGYQPDITVATLVVRDGRFLTIEEHVRGERVLNQPAGHVEPGERLADAAVRETLEETGWQVRPVAFVGVYQWQAPAPGTAYLRFVFAAEPMQQQTGPQEPGVLRTHWLSPSELRRAAVPLRTPLVLLAVDDYLAGRRWPLSVVQQP